MASEEMQIGRARERVDGALKVSGRAMYAGDAVAEGMCHAVLVQATIARGTIEGIDSTAAEGSAGVIAVFTHANLPVLQPPPGSFSKDFPAERRAPLSNAAVHYAGQHVAIVLAETLVEAQAAAALVRVHYAAETPVLALAPGMPGTYEPDHFATNDKEKLRSGRGVVPVSPAHRLELHYRTPIVHHNPLEPSATVAEWHGDRLLLHDSTRWVQGSARILAHMLGIPEENVEVRAPFVGGAFGSKGFLWQHVALAVQAARVVGRPVKLVLSRQQMFTSTGHRPRTEQRLVMASDAAGALTSVEHHTLSETSPVAHFVEPAGMTSRNLYRTPHTAISHRVTPTNLATPCFMRAPGESPGMFALESAIDEMAAACGQDPLAFRLANYAEQDEEEGRPWSSKHLRECYAAGAKRFGWDERPLAPRSMKRDGKLLGWGMATAAYPARRSPVTVRARLARDGQAHFTAATHEIGGGTATVMEQIAADVLQMPIEQVHFELGDSAYTQAPVAGASQTVASVGPAVRAAAEQLRGRMAGLRFSIEQEIEVEAQAEPDKQAVEAYTFHSFGAHFCEVEIDPVTVRLRVTRWVAAMDCGRILNPMTARSQVMGGIIFGLGMALLEETSYDPRTGMPMNADLADYLLPTCADAPKIEVELIERPDLHFNPLGIRGIGEIGITGVPAAIANAVCHACGARIRELPITVERLLASGMMRSA